MPEGQALVLGGGGVAGIAWMTGVLAGLADTGQDVTGGATSTAASGPVITRTSRRAPPGS